LAIGIHFIQDPEEANLRAQAVEASRNTLLAVVRLLVMADMVMKL
jgi:hypothetical protein